MGALFWKEEDKCCWSWTHIYWQSSSAPPASAAPPAKITPSFSHTLICSLSKGRSWGCTRHHSNFLTASSTHLHYRTHFLLLYACRRSFIQLTYSTAGPYRWKWPQYITSERSGGLMRSSINTAYLIASSAEMSNLKTYCLVCNLLKNDATLLLSSQVLSSCRNFCNKCSFFPLSLSKLMH